VDAAGYELSGKQPVLYLPPPPEHPPPSDIGSPPDSPSDPRYPCRRLLHSDCEPSSPAQRRVHHPVPANRYATSGAKLSRAQRKALGGDGRPPQPAARTRRGGPPPAAELHPASWIDAAEYSQYDHHHHYILIKLQYTSRPTVHKTCRPTNSMCDCDLDYRPLFSS